MKNRLIVLTDISHGFEEDDIESMVRLMLYTNEIDIEGLIATTSCWYKDIAREENNNIITDIIDAYGKVKKNLDIHEEGYPEPEYLRNITKCGISKFGTAEGDGWGEEQFDDNPGVNLIIKAADREDKRPLWITLWGGANTLAHAVWKVWKTRNNNEFNEFLSRLRVYGISDQDFGGIWLREKFGDRLFYIVSPCPGDERGGDYYRLATWPGISGDNFMHGSEDGINGDGFSGADSSLISREWLRENIISHGGLGEKYPVYQWLMEGDTPSYLYLIPNGLGVPEHPDYGSWGGRYEFYIPDKKHVWTDEKYPLWTNAFDNVRSNDGKWHRSPQTSIWRWREAYQHDFSARMDWTITGKYEDANHPPVVRLGHKNELTVKRGEYVNLSAEGTFDPDGDDIKYNWMFYKEAGSFDGDIHIDNEDSKIAGFKAPETDKEVNIHIILIVRDYGEPALTRYQRVIVAVK